MANREGKMERKFLILSVTCPHQKVTKQHKELAGHFTPVEGH